MQINKLTNTLRKILPLKYCGAVIVAAGSASRMQGIDKVMAELGGEPMILRTVRAFQNSDVIRQIVVVTRPDLIEGDCGCGRGRRPSRVCPKRAEGAACESAPCGYSGRGKTPYYG